MADSHSTQPTGRVLGALKTAARKAGVTLDEYNQRRAGGEKWCNRCSAWHRFSEFGRDVSRWDGLDAACKASRRGVYEASHVPVAIDDRKPMGPAPQPARDDDRRQARQRINKEVRRGVRPHPNLLPCTDCGQHWSPGLKRHEYDHHLGYAAEHHGDVQPVCTRCHTAREIARGQWGGRRSSGSGEPTAPTAIQ